MEALGGLSFYFRLTRCYFHLIWKLDPSSNFHPSIFHHPVHYFISSQRSTLVDIVSEMTLNYPLVSEMTLNYSLVRHKSR
jgi:hypothetical protein